jgi:hypothetical protein
MVLGFYGHSLGDPDLAFEYDDRLITHDEMSTLRIEYAAAHPVQQQVDHFTVHCERGNFANGEFHLRASYGSRPIHNVSIPPPLNSASGVFLDFIVFTDDLSNYDAYTEPLTDLDVVIPVENRQVLLLRGRFSGVDFDLESIVADEERRLGRYNFPAIVLTGKTLKGAFTWTNIDVPSNGLENRPGGTYALVRFLNDSANYLVKTFVFA